MNEITPIPPGWLGGFEASNPAFAYPDPDLSSLPMLGNMDNISLLQRQLPVAWPEFSWELEQGNEATRCYQMFAPYISRVGYTDAGRIYSIICPQQGVWFEDQLCLNVEVTVTGQRGWVDESAAGSPTVVEGPDAPPILAADMTVEGRVWFTPGLHIDRELKALLWLLRASGQGFPLTKSTAIRVTTHHQDDPTQPIFPVRAGLSPEFDNPDFALHPEAWGTGNIAVEIGPIVPTHRRAVDDFNEAVMSVFNLASGNMLRPNNVLSWNLWFRHPELVNQAEWADHADKWRKSIDTHHGSPRGEGTSPRYADGSPVHALKTDLLDDLKRLLETHLQAI